jgi:hypothetical protein
MGGTLRWGHRDDKVRVFALEVLNKVMMVNFMCQFSWTMVPRYVVKSSVHPVVLFPPEMRLTFKLVDFELSRVS